MLSPLNEIPAMVMNRMIEIPHDKWASRARFFWDRSALLLLHQPCVVITGNHPQQG